MTFKKAIAKAINETTKFQTKKVWGFTTQTNGMGETTMYIELMVTKKKAVKPAQP